MLSEKVSRLMFVENSWMLTRPGVGDGVGALGKGLGDTVSGASQGVGNTTKAVGDTANTYVNKATAQNPLGLSEEK